MRIKIILQHQPKIILPFDYQYAVQAWIYKVLAKANEELAKQLHDHGYAVEGKTFKLFCFSPWNGYPYKIIPGKGIQLQGDSSELQVSFLIPENMQTFVAGLFQKMEHTFYFKGNHVIETYINHIEILQNPQWRDGLQNYTLRSGARISKKLLDHEHPQYLMPTDDGYCDQFLQNIKHKLQATGTLIPEYIKPTLHITSDFKPHKYNIPKADELIEMKTASFSFSLDAPREWHHALYYAGAGEECSLGLGWAERLLTND